MKSSIKSLHELSNCKEGEVFFFVTGRPYDCFSLRTSKGSRCGGSGAQGYEGQSSDSLVTRLEVLHWCVSFDSEAPPLNGSRCVNLSPLQIVSVRALGVANFNFNVII